MYERPTTVDDDLRRIRLETNQLRVLVSMLADEPPEVRDVWHWQWDRLLNRVEALCLQHQDGHLSPEQEREFLELSRLLTSNRALVEALGCQFPPVLGQVVDVGA